MTSAPTIIRRRRRQISYLNLMYLPALLILGAFVVLPLLDGVSLAFTNWNGYSPNRSFVGFSNFERLATDPVLRTAFLNTLIYGVGSTLLQQVLGLGLALLLDRPTRSRTLIRAIIYLPVLVSPVVMGMMYYLVFQYGRGALNDIVVTFGGERVPWLSDGPTAVAIILLINTVQFTGISMVIYLAGLQGVPPELLEASTLDGANSWQRFWNVVFPLLQPAIASSVVINLIGGLKLFDVVQVLTAGGPGYASHSVSTLIGLTYFGQQSAGYAAAMGIVLFVLIAVTTAPLVVRWSRDRSMS